MNLQSDILIQIGMCNIKYSSDLTVALGLLATEAQLFTGI